MKKQLLSVLTLLAFALFLGSVACAAPITFIEQGSEWQYEQFSTPDLWDDWANADLTSFDWSSASWLTGNASFGNQPYGGLTPNTNWDANTELALMQTFTVDGTLTGDLSLNIASDNGFLVFINGNQVAKENAESFTSYWEYGFTLSNSLFLTPGDNLIQVLAEDHGGITFFDLELSGDVAPVPEPATLLLLGSGLAGLAFYRRKKK